MHLANTRLSVSAVLKQTVLTPQPVIFWSGKDWKLAGGIITSQPDPYYPTIQGYLLYLSDVIK
jgi:hypothetical protein